MLQKLVKKCNYLNVLFGMYLTCRSASNGKQSFCVYSSLLVCAFILLLVFCMYGIW
jgi:hypothetical protein